MALTMSNVQKRITWGILMFTLLLQIVYCQEAPIDEEPTKTKLDITGYSKYVVPAVIIIFSIAIAVGVFVLLVKDALRR
jgi:hypothetical protein